jgi:hypothetical protein
MTELSYVDAVTKIRVRVHDRSRLGFALEGPLLARGTIVGQALRLYG